jgi:hypothetical protein
MTNRAPEARSTTVRPTPPTLGGNALKLLSTLVLATLALASCGSSTPDLSQDPDPVPVQWDNRDVGDVGHPGEVVPASTGDPSIVRGAGTDVYGSSDGFHYAFTELSGDGSIVSRVLDVEHVDDWTKAGVMMRSSIDPRAQNVFVHMSPENGAVMQARAGSGEITQEPGWDRAPRPPEWVRLERRGNTFTGAVSDDGQNWSLLGAITVDMPETVLVGLAVTSKDPGRLAEATFEGTVVTSAGGEPGAPGGPVPAPGGPRTTVHFTPDTRPFPNPERGWYFERASSDYASFAGNGYRLALRYVNLADYRYSDIPQSLLDQLRTDFANARNAGIKLVVRFAYNRSFGDDAPIDSVLRHVDQVGPVLRENVDVIAAMQAGFIGAWGEWHASTHDLLDPVNRDRIVDSLLRELPVSRMIQLRYPRHGRDIFPNPPTAATAFDGSDPSRTGQLNDCFLSSSSDTGTYESDADRAYARAVSRLTVMGGETCDLGGLWERNYCPNALVEMAEHNWDYLNHEFWRPIIDQWRSQGCHDEIEARLGYRYELRQVTSPERLVPGMSLAMEIEIANRGFGKLYNPRPLQVVLVPTAGGAPVVVDAIVDARTVLPLGGETTTVPVDAALPSGTPPGSYFVYLKLPDAAAQLRNDPRYSIRLANQGVWDSSLGANDLNLWVTVDPL